MTVLIGQSMRDRMTSSMCTVHHSASAVCIFQVEAVMRQSLQEVMVRAVESYPTTPRKEWVMNWPGQVVLDSSKLQWTAEVTQVNPEDEIHYITLTLTYISFYQRVTKS